MTCETKSVNDHDELNKEYEIGKMKDDEAIDKVKEMMYNGDIIEYSICICKYERVDNELLEECN